MKIALVVLNLFKKKCMFIAAIQSYFFMLDCFVFTPPHSKVLQHFCYLTTPLTELIIQSFPSLLLKYLTYVTDADSLLHSPWLSCALAYQLQPFFVRKADI